MYGFTGNAIPSGPLKQNVVGRIFDPTPVNMPIDFYTQMIEIELVDHDL